MEGLTFHTRAATAGCSLDQGPRRQEALLGFLGLVSALPACLLLPGNLVTSQASQTCLGLYSWL